MPILQSRLLVIPPDVAPLLLTLVDAGHPSMRTSLPDPFCASLPSCASSPATPSLLGSG